MKLPSKLTTFEQFLYFDDYPAYPNTIGCRLNLTGPLDVPALELAVNTAINRNPMVCATLGQRGKRIFWNEVQSPHALAQIEDKYIDQCFIKKIDLETEQGAQIYWAHCDNRSSLNFLTHHAAADGLGGLKVVNEVLTAYSTACEAGRPFDNSLSEKISARLGRNDHGLLNRRGNFRFCSWRFFKSIPRQFIGLFGVKEFFANQPETLTGQRHGSLSEPIPDNYPGILTRFIGDIELLRSHAAQSSLTANELILYCIFSATAKWRRELGFGSDEDLLRIMVPINLRSVADRYLPACHRSSMVTLDRKQEKCLNEKDLMNSIRFQMNVIKSNELGYTFLHMLNLSRWFPGGIRRFADPDRVGATMIVTNLGEPFRRSKLPRNEEGKLQVGPQTLDGVELIPPLRPNTQAAFAIGRYAGKTFLTLIFDNRVISESSANSLFSQVCNEFQAKTGIVPD